MGLSPRNVALERGDLYVVFTVGGAKGERPNSQVCSLQATSAFTSSVAQKAGGTFAVQKMAGFQALPKNLRVRATALLKPSPSKKRQASVLKVDTSKKAKLMKS